MALLIISKIVIIACFFMLGGSIASFLGVVIERGKRKESIMGRSHCACGRPLKWYENVPVFGWLRVMGTTKCCHTKLPIWYLFFELGLGLIFGAIAFIILL
jgi:prepilin signal peptidase PulO-like enzyme (type II secretory pathway)